MNLVERLKWRFSFCKRERLRSKWKCHENENLSCKERIWRWKKEEEEEEKFSILCVSWETERDWKKGKFRGCTRGNSTRGTRRFIVIYTCDMVAYRFSVLQWTNMVCYVCLCLMYSVRLVRYLTLSFLLSISAVNVFELTISSSL